MRSISLLADLRQKVGSLRDQREDVIQDNQKGVSLDNNSLSESIIIDDDIVTIYGIKYAGGLFRLLGGLLPINKLIRIIKREDGVITLDSCD